MKNINPSLCARTLAIYRPNQKLPGVRCSYYWTGKIPCTGRRICHLCGEEYNKLDPA